MAVAAAATATRPTPKARRTRARILEAAETCFARDGFERASLDAIGQELGIAPSGILYHFADKRALYFEVLERTFGGGLDCVSEALESEGALLVRMERAIGEGVRYLAARPATARILLREASSRDPAIRGALRRHTERVVGLLDAFLASGVAGGVLRPMCLGSAHFLTAIFGALLFYVGALPAFLSPDDPDHLGPEDVAALEREMIAIARTLLGVAPAAAAA